MDKGRISLYATVWCACEHWVHINEKSVAKAAVVAERMGWVKDREKGWMCWCCQGKMSTYDCGRKCGQMPTCAYCGHTFEEHRSGEPHAKEGRWCLHGWWTKRGRIGWNENACDCANYERPS